MKIFMLVLTVLMMGCNPEPTAEETAIKIVEVAQQDYIHGVITTIGEYCTTVDSAGKLCNYTIKWLGFVCYGEEFNSYIDSQNERGIIGSYYMDYLSMLSVYERVRNTKINTAYKEKRNKELHKNDNI